MNDNMLLLAWLLFRQQRTGQEAVVYFDLQIITCQV